MKIRVLRLLEYTYSSVEAMERDMEKWQHGTHRYGSNYAVVKSVTLPLEVLQDEEEA